jgi:hypothetical protein
MCTIDSGSVSLPAGCETLQVSWQTRGEFRSLLRQLKLQNNWRALAILNYVAGRPSPRRHAAFLDAVA